MAYHPYYQPEYQQPYQPNRYLGGFGGGQNLGYLQQLVQLLLGGGQGAQQTAAAEVPAFNPYMDNIYRPSPMGLSPIARYNDMVNRRQAELAAANAAGKEAVAAVNARNADAAGQANRPSVLVPTGDGRMELIDPEIHKYGRAFAGPPSLGGGRFLAPTGEMLPMHAPANDPGARTWIMENASARAPFQRTPAEDQESEQEKRFSKISKSLGLTQ
jgi:hypothetical protein